MGSLTLVPVGNMRIDFGLTAMVETGTEGGGGIEVGLRAGYTKIISCEIIEGRYKQARDLFKDNVGIKVFLGDSRIMLPKMLNEIEKDNVLFWLDAHLPNHSVLRGTQKFDIEEILPLKDELGIILKNRDCSHDVFVIDDLCLFDQKYRKDNFDLKHWAESNGERDFPIEQILSLFPYHNWRVLDKAEQYLILTPKEKSCG